MSLEKELALWKKVADAQKDRCIVVEGETSEWRQRAQGERKAAEEVSRGYVHSIRC